VKAMRLLYKKVVLKLLTNIETSNNIRQYISSPQSLSKGLCIAEDFAALAYRQAGSKNKVATKQ
jgi:hypothetical protein